MLIPYNLPPLLCIKKGKVYFITTFYRS